MNVNELRVAVTVMSFIVFLGIFVWAWSRRRSDGFAEAAQLPFVDEAPRAERGAAPEPARIPLGDRPMYSSGEGPTP